VWGGRPKKVNNSLQRRPVCNEEVGGREGDKWSQLQGGGRSPGEGNLAQESTPKQV